MASVGVTGTDDRAREASSALEKKSLGSERG